MISTNVSSKIVIIGTSLDGKGGIAILLRSYSRILRPFYYICSHKSAKRIYQIGLAIVALFKTIFYCIFHRVQIVHIHTASYRSFFRESIYVFVAKIFHKKVILHLHGGEFEIFYKRYPHYCNYVCHKANCIVAVSEYFGHVFKNLSLNENVFVLYNIIEKPFFEKSNFQHRKLRILFLGTIDENKGIFDVIDCFIDKKQSLKDKIIFDIGGVGDSLRLQKMIHTGGIDDFVNYHGWLDTENKNKLLAQTDLYIQPSYFESLGIAILEAMSYKIPVIASNTGGIPEIVHDGENGFLIQPGNMCQFYDKLNYFIQHKEALKIMGDKSYMMAIQFYPENIEKKIIEIYKSLL